MGPDHEVLTLDWASRIRQHLWNDTELFFMATSPGGRGAQTILRLAAEYAPFMGGKMSGTFSLPRFSQNFQDGQIVDPVLKKKLTTKLAVLTTAPTEETDGLWIRFLKSMSKVWNLTGWTTFVGISVSGFVGSALLFSPYAALFGRLRFVRPCSR